MTNSDWQTGHSLAEAAGADAGDPARGRGLKAMLPTGLTVPVGRFLIDLPGDACPGFGRQGFNEAGPFIQTLPVPGPAAARAMVEGRAATLRVPHEEGGTQLERVVEGRRPHSWFIYFWKDTAFKDETLELNGYFWLDGLLFIFKNTCLADPVDMAGQARLLEAMFGLVRKRALLEVPVEPGFCFREGFFPGEAGRFSDEHIELLATFASKPGVSLRFTTDTVGEVVANYALLLERDGQCPAGRKGPGGTRLRAGDRCVGRFPGQELIKRVSHPGGGAGLACTWEYLGKPRDPFSPMLVLEMRTRGRNGKVGNTWVNEPDVLALWDSVLGSLRWRESFLRYLRLPEAIQSSWSM